MFANSNKNIVLCHDYLKCKVTDAHYLVHALEIHTKNELKGSTYRTVAPTILLSHHHLTCSLKISIIVLSYLLFVCSLSSYLAKKGGE